MIQIVVEIPNMDELTCGTCPCFDHEWNACNLEYAINGSFREVDTIYHSRPENCPIKHLSKGGQS